MDYREGFFDRRTPIAVWDEQQQQQRQKIRNEIKVSKTVHGLSERKHLDRIREGKIIMKIHNNEIAFKVVSAEKIRLEQHDDVRETFNELTRYFRILLLLYTILCCCAGELRIIVHDAMASAVA